MTDEPGLFPDPGLPLGQEIQVCDLCPEIEIASLDGLRVRGWAAFSGESVTGKHLETRLCPACRRGK